MRANIPIAFSLLFLVGSPSVPSGLWRRGLILCHIRDVRGLLSLLGDRGEIWTQIQLTSNPELLESETLRPFHHPPWQPPNEAGWEVFLPFASPSWRMSRFCSSSFFFFYYSRYAPHSFIKTGRNAYRVQSNAVSIGLILSREREAMEEIDPRVRSQTQRQRYSKEVPAVCMFIFLFFLFFPFGCTILNAESYFPNQESNLCPLHWPLWVLTTGLPGKILFIFYCKHNRYSLKKAGTTKKSIKKEMSPALLTFCYACWKNFPPIYR